LKTEPTKHNEKERIHKTKKIIFPLPALHTDGRSGKGNECACSRKIVPKWNCTATHNHGENTAGRLKSLYGGTSFIINLCVGIQKYSKLLAIYI